LKIRLRPDLSFPIRQNPAPAGLEEYKSGTALTVTAAQYTGMPPDTRLDAGKLFQMLGHTNL